MLTIESSNFFDSPQVTKYGLSYLADNLILLEYFPDGADMRRILRILKMRGSPHMTEMREYKISGQGPVVLDKPLRYKKSTRLNACRKAALDRKVSDGI